MKSMQHAAAHIGTWKRRDKLKAEILTISRNYEDKIIRPFFLSMDLVEEFNTQEPWGMTNGVKVALGSRVPLLGIPLCCLHPSLMRCLTGGGALMDCGGLWSKGMEQTSRN